MSRTEQTFEDLKTYFRTHSKIREQRPHMSKVSVEISHGSVAGINLFIFSSLARRFTRFAGTPMDATWPQDRLTKL